MTPTPLMVIEDTLTEALLPESPTVILPVADFAGMTPALNDTVPRIFGYEWVLVLTAWQLEKLELVHQRTVLG
jgi:hypothetical protein